jgi:hypothetical protein
MGLERLIANLQGGYRRAMLEGRPHLVVNIAVMGDDVLEGSEGAFWYPAEENAKATPLWNARPLVVYHPRMGSDYSSAGTPEVFNEQKVGTIFNTNHTTKVYTEGWFDEERTKQIDPRVYRAVLNRQPMEVSGGVFVDPDYTPGVHPNGKKYRGIAKNQRPDHVAVLPDKIGAYSITMGGGLFANAALELDAPVDELYAELRLLLDNRDFSQDQRTKLSKSGAAMPDGSFPIENEQDLKNAIRAIGRAKNPAAARAHVVQRAKALGLTKLLPGSWNVTANELAANDLSFSQIAAQLNSSLGAMHGEKGKDWPGYLYDVFPDRVVFSNGQGKLYSHGYSVSNDKVSLNGTPVEVVRTTDYTPVKNEGGAKETEMAFDKKAHVTSLIGNGWEESDRSWLEDLPDDKLQKMKPVANTTVPPPPPASPPPPAVPPAAPVAIMNVADWLKSTNAPPAIVQQVERGLKADKAQKDALVSVIMANTANPFSKEFLEGKQIEELEGLARIAASGQSSPDGTNGGMFLPGAMGIYNNFPQLAGANLPNYVGMAGFHPGYIANQAGGQQPGVPTDLLEPPDPFAPEPSANGTAAAK